VHRTSCKGLCFSSLNRNLNTDGTILFISYERGVYESEDVLIYITFVALTLHVLASRQHHECSPLHIAQTGSGVHPASFPMRIVDRSQGVKLQEREANQSRLTRAEVKKM
jgi:hypothetical protein